MPRYPKITAVPESKKCTKCQVVKPGTEFYRKKDSFALNSYCKVCVCIYSKAWGIKNIGKRRAKQNKYQRTKRIAQRYGLTVEGWDVMFKKQKGECSICRRSQEDVGKRFHVDHCHENGKVRSLLCAKCNLIIGMVNEDPNILVAMAEYLRQHLDS